MPGAEGGVSMLTKILRAAKELRGKLYGQRRNVPAPVEQPGRRGLTRADFMGWADGMSIYRYAQGLRRKQRRARIRRRGY